MKFHKRLLLVFIVFLLYNCSNSEKNTTTTPQSEGIVDDEPLLSFKEGAIYEGLLGDKYAIRLRIQSISDSGEVLAAYYYEGITHYIPLHGEKKDNKLRLLNDRIDMPNEVFDGELDARGHFTGHWEKEDGKKFSFDLRAVCPVLNVEPLSTAALLRYFQPIDLPHLSEQFEEAPPPFYREHLFPAGLQNCPCRCELLEKHGLLDLQKEEQRCYFGSYFKNVSGNYVLLYLNENQMAFTAAIISPNGRLLDKQLLAYIAYLPNGVENFAFFVNRYQVLQIINADQYFEEDQINRKVDKKDAIQYNLRNKKIETLDD